MAERNSNNRRNGSGGLSARDAIRRVREDFPELFGRPIESLIGVERDEEKGWKVNVQVVELSRIPSTTDVLGSYAVTLDANGDLVGYRRNRRYHRNQVEED